MRLGNHATHTLKLGIMTNTAQGVQELTQAIFVRFDFDGEWTILRTLTGEVITDVIEGQAFLRKHVTDKIWEIANLEQALIGNGMIDNV